MIEPLSTKCSFFFFFSVIQTPHYLDRKMQYRWLHDMCSLLLLYTDEWMHLEKVWSVIPKLSMSYNNNSSSISRNLKKQN